MVSQDNSPVCKANGNWDLTEDNLDGKRLGAGGEGDDRG